MKAFRVTREFPLALRLLLINQFGIDIGFYILVPFLAAYLGQELGMSDALVGLVLGVRNLGQQGLFLLGGSAADRLGPRAVIIAGCALRTLGFSLFAFGTSLPVVLGASLFNGLAAGLFYPSARAYAALEAGDRKAEVFALLNAYATIGSLIGLLLGSVLIQTDFRVCAVAAAGVYGLLTVGQALVLPDREPPTANRSTTVLGDWLEVFGNRRFLLFSLATTGMFTVENQLCLLLPAGARQASGWEGAAGVLLGAGAVANLFQMPITRALERHGGGQRWVGAGLVVMGLGFLPPLLICADGPPAGTREVVPRMLVMLAGSLLLYFGTMIAHPAVLEMIPRFGRETLAGTYFGLFYVFAGLTAAGGNAVVGWTMDTAKRFDCPWLPWLGCVAFGFSSALAVAVLHRTRLLPGREGAPVVEGTVILPGPPERTHATAEAAPGPVGPTAEAVGRWEVGHRDRARLPGPVRAADDATDQPPR
ncbi:MFS transporter [Streptomyces sp. AV19]|uniref:MFS transporter n=1 Tax=Streptomyces sp. AV19 TaxID=2793068 RepID=UPI0018FEBFB2|nr:MFS transporter [Streptomyces sp. AV19]MBH1937152.1 MFS transporter [Streptomyces sp. AV19]MDG4533179.1 MFS transporter [Streptomyces sp. AV19]